MVLSAGVVGLLVLAAGWLLDHLTGEAGSGLLEGNGQAPMSQVAPSAPPASPATAPVKPIEVTIREDGYLVDAQEESKDQIVAAAQAAIAGGALNGPAVKIITGPDSREGAQSDLQNALDDAHIPWALEAEPASKP